MECIFIYIRIGIMSSLQSFFTARLQERTQQGSLRTLRDNPSLVDFTSNDYLGLARSPALAGIIHKTQEQKFQYANGATGSRLLAGNTAYYQQVEAGLASIFKADAALILNSGYAANLAVLSSIPQRGDTILYDELSHASIKDGARLSLAKRFSFRHNDLNDLETKLARATGKIFIAVESVYSMDGDECPIQDLVVLAEKYDASVVLDEAHSTGVMGEQGSGQSVAQQLHNRIAIRIYTFGKAMGIHGACVVGSSHLIQYLINFARPFIYTTALPPHSVVAIESAFTYLQKNIHLQQQLQDNITLYRQQTAHLTNRTQSRSAIQTALFAGNDSVRQAALSLQQSGFDVRPILSPTVATGSERLRICLHAFNTTEEITQLTAALNKLSMKP